MKNEPLCETWHDHITSCSESPTRCHDIPISCSETDVICTHLDRGLCDECTIRQYCDEDTGMISCSLRTLLLRHDVAWERLEKLIDKTPQAVESLYKRVKKEIMDRSARRGRDDGKEEDVSTLDSHMSKVYERVEHPVHYNQHPSGVECITVIECMTFNVGTAMKHLWRAGLKPGASTLDDLQKAARYIQFEIEKIERESAK